MMKEAPLPDRCVKCNAPANGVRLRRSLSWHHPVLYVLIFVGVLIYVILAAVLSKRAMIYVGLCAEHFQRRRKRIAIGWILLASGLLFAPVAFANDYPLMGVLGLTVFLFGLIWLIVVSRVVTPKIQSRCSQGTDSEGVDDSSPEARGRVYSRHAVALWL